MGFIRLDLPPIIPRAKQDIGRFEDLGIPQIWSYNLLFPEGGNPSFRISVFQGLLFSLDSGSNVV